MFPPLLSVSGLVLVASAGAVLLSPWLEKLSRSGVSGCSVWHVPPGPLVGTDHHTQHLSTCTLPLPNDTSSVVVNSGVEIQGLTILN